MTRSLAIQRFRRSELEARIEEMIALLDLLDGDPELEDDELEDDPAEMGIADLGGLAEQAPFFGFCFEHAV